MGVGNDEHRQISDYKTKGMKPKKNESSGSIRSKFLCPSKGLGLVFQFL